MGKRCLNASSSAADLSTGWYRRDFYCSHAPTWTPVGWQSLDLECTATPTAASCRGGEGRAHGSTSTMVSMQNQSAAAPLGERCQHLVLPGPITAHWGTSFKLEGKEAGVNYVLFDLGNGNPLSFTTSSFRCCRLWCQDSCRDLCRGRENTVMAFRVQKYKTCVLKYTSR